MNHLSCPLSLKVNILMKQVGLIHSLIQPLNKNEFIHNKPVFLYLSSFLPKYVFEYLSFPFDHRKLEDKKKKSHVIKLWIP